jgi:type II secretory pathway predicted ATPase ExeA
LDFYQLKEQPFGVTPNPEFLYLGDQYREALASLVYGMRAGRGFHALIAPPGLGKTTLLFRFVTHFRNANKCVFLFNTLCSPREFLRSVISDLDIGTPGQDLADMQSQLNEFLVRTAQEGKEFILVIDEAQNLTDDVLEMVRLLSDFETPRRKLMHIVLAGQPQLETKLSQAQLTQLRQRISLISWLKPLDREQVHQYVEWRLRVAGSVDGKVFQPDALDLIAAHSGGIPRNINNLCFHALSLGYAKGKAKITREVVGEAIADNVLGAGVQAAPVTPNVAGKQELKRAFVAPAKPAATTAFGFPRQVREQWQRVRREWRAKQAFRVAVYVCVGILVEALLTFHNPPRKDVSASMIQPAASNASSIVSSASQAEPAADAARPEITTKNPAEAAPESAPIASDVEIASYIESYIEKVPLPGQRQLVVHANDTLWRISLRELPSTPPKQAIVQILGLNEDLENPDRIRPGQKILLPSPQEEQEVTNTGSTDSKQPSGSRSEPR